MCQEITIIKPFDGHLHLRNGRMMEHVLPFSAARFSGGVCMGNLPGDEVIDTLEKHQAYLEQIKAIAPGFNAIVPLMVTKSFLETKGLTLKAMDAGARFFKFIPEGLTTNGAEGLTLYDFCSTPFRKFFEHLEACGGIFLCHFEVNSARIFGSPIHPLNQEREAIHFLKQLLYEFPRLNIVVEHASTEEMIDFIGHLPRRYKVAATLTPHHARITYHDVMCCDVVFENSLLYCKPIAKLKDDVNAVKLAMCSGNPRFFAGTDSAPHPLAAKTRKENPAAGIFSAPVALQCYANIFDELGRREYLENFASVFGPRFYGISPSEEKITLLKEEQTVPEVYCGIPVFLGGGDPIPWRIK